MRWRLIGATVIPALALARQAFAHEKWFVAAEPVGDIPAFFRELTWQTAVVAVAVLVAVVGLVALDRRRGRHTAVSAIHHLVPWAPTILGMATGISLALAALDRTLFAPNFSLPDGFFGTAAVGLELAVAVCLLTGLLTRPAAVVLLALSAASFAWFRLDALDYANIAGIAFFLLVWGRGRLSLGSVFGRVFFAMDVEHVKPMATVVLRVLTGLTFTILGFEKVLRPDLHLTLLSIFPDNNPYTMFHMALPFLTKDWYLLLSALGEMALGLLVIAGAFLRPLTVCLLIPFLVYPFFFGMPEIAGHLPAMATLAVLFILGRDAQYRTRG